MRITNEETIELLLIEDDDSDYILIKDLLERMRKTKYHLIWAKNPEQALKFVSENSYHLLIIDYYLGEKNALELLKEIRDRKINTPAIIVTGGIDGDIDLEITDYGAWDFICKEEMNNKNLERSIRYTLELYDLQREVTRKKDLLDLMFETLPISVVLVDQNCNICQYNKTFLDMFGLTKGDISTYKFDELISVSPFKNDLYDKGNLDENCNEDISLCNSGKKTVEGRASSRNGNIIDILSKTGTITFLNGHHQMFTIIAMVNIGQQKQTETKLCATLKETQKIIEKHGLETQNLEVMFDLVDLEVNKMANSILV